jgi:hypothetical protein
LDWLLIRSNGSGRSPFDFGQDRLTAPAWLGRETGHSEADYLRGVTLWPALNVGAWSSFLMKKQLLKI